MTSPDNRKIVVFGATGYTGGLAVSSLVGRGLRPVLAARSEARLAALSREYGGLEYQVADVTAPDSVRALVDAGDVLVTGVGPFERYGWVAAEAAAEVGAHYVDSTGKVGFVRELHRRHDAQAREIGSIMLPAFGYDYVPGILAGSLALDDAGASAHSVDIGYFASGPLRNGLSQGTRKTIVDGMSLPVAVCDDGRLVDRRAAQNVTRFDAAGRRRSAILATGTEVLQLPRRYPHLRNVRVFNGWFPHLARPVQAMSLVATTFARRPLGRRVLDAMAPRLIGPAGGPDATERARTHRSRHSGSGALQLPARSVASPAARGPTAGSRCHEQRLRCRTVGTTDLVPPRGTRGPHDPVQVVVRSRSDRGRRVERRRSGQGGRSRAAG